MRTARERLKELVPDSRIGGDLTAGELSIATQMANRLQTYMTMELILSDVEWSRGFRCGVVSGVPDVLRPKVASAPLKWFSK